MSSLGHSEWDVVFGELKDIRIRVVLPGITVGLRATVKVPARSSIRPKVLGAGLVKISPFLT